MAPDHAWTAEDPDAVDVRHIQPYQAVKTYRCPGCDHEIRPGIGHEVVVPRADPDGRRHWHTPCWAAEQRRANGPRRGKRARRPPP